MSKCVKCQKEIKGEFFEGASGPLCSECLKDMWVYYALRALGVLKNTEELECAG